MQKVLLIGGTGSLGRAYIERFQHKYKLYVLSRDETKQWELKHKYQKVTFIIGNICIKEKLDDILPSINPHKIVVLAAMKHIDICETNPDQCVRTNIIGLQNILSVISTSTICGLMKNLLSVCFMSTDKAATPSSVYGMTKFICEKLMIEKSQKLDDIKFVSVRGGNFLDSRCSIIPIFRKIAVDPDRQYFTVTHPKMSRYFITLQEGAELIEYACSEGESGDIIIPKMTAVKIMDIAKHFKNMYNKPIKIIGIRPGEKLSEDLLSENELSHTIQNENYYIIKPNPVEHSLDHNVNSNIEENKDKINQILSKVLPIQKN